MAENKRPLKVFLSHASQDRSNVRALYRRLDEDGLDVWLDSERLLGGMDWSREIPNAVRSSDVVLICLSKNSVDKEGYVQKEIKHAIDIANEKPEGSLFIIPVRLEECKVPSYLSRWQWIDLFQTNGYESLLRTLRARSNQLGLRPEKIQYQRSYWASILDSVQNADNLDSIASLSGSIRLSSTDDDNVRNFVVGVDQISRYVLAALSSETIYNRQQQLESALQNTDNLIEYFESQPEWLYPNEVLNVLTGWEKTIENEKSKYKKHEAIPNVYVAGSPLSEKSKVFKGRKDVFRMLEHELTTQAEQRPPLLLFGARRTGKTSVLRQLPDVLGPQVVPVMVDLQNLALTNDIATFFQKLSVEIQKSALTSRRIKLTAISQKALKKDPYMIFAEWIKNTEKSLKGKWLLLSLDEYEYIEKMYSDKRADERIFQLIRSLLQNFPTLTLLFSGAHTFEELSPIWSHYLINVRTIRIGQLRDKDARDLIEKPIESFPLEHTKQSVERILSAVGGQPYLLQATCRDLVNLLNDEKKFEATEKDVDKALSSVLTTASAYFKEIWSGPDSSDTHRSIMTEIAKKKGKPALEENLRLIGDPAVIRSLEHRDIIEKVADGFCFKVELVRMWVEQQL